MSDSATSRVGVMHLVDTLQFGGAERAAVQYVNHLPRALYRPFLCTTREAGPLEPTLFDDVCRLHLGRRRRFELAPLLRLRRYVREEGIKLLHAHGSTLFVARLAQSVKPHPAVIWHLHYGRWASEDCFDWRYWPASLGIDSIVTSNDQLAQWIPRRFPVAAERVEHLPNMVTFGLRHSEKAALPGRRGARIVSVANLRPEKDHLTLIRAFASVIVNFPEAHLILIGAHQNPEVVRTVEYEIQHLNLNSRISLMGPRSDIYTILLQVDVGVLSSSSEGLPVALLEYGAAGLPAVATAVGQCPDVLDYGRAGLLVPPQSPSSLADALQRLLSSEELRRDFGGRLKQRVDERYGQKAVIALLCDLYARTLAKRNAR